MKRNFEERLKALEDSLTAQDPVAIVEPVPGGYLLKTGEQCSYTVKKQQHKLRTAYPTILYQSGAVTRKCCCSIFMPLK